MQKAETKKERQKFNRPAGGLRVGARVCAAQGRKERQ